MSMFGLHIINEESIDSKRNRLRDTIDKMTDRIGYSIPADGDTELDKSINAINQAVQDGEQGDALELLTDLLNARSGRTGDDRLQPPNRSNNIEVEPKQDVSIEKTMVKGDISALYRHFDDVVDDRPHLSMIRCYECGKDVEYPRHTSRMFVTQTVIMPIADCWGWADGSTLKVIVMHYKCSERFESRRNSV